MSRGNQRDIDRAKNQAKNQAKLKQAAVRKGGGNVMIRNENDASALQAKLAKKQALAEEQAAEQAANPQATAKAPVVPKKKLTAKPKDNFDDLLSAGLGPGTKKRVKA